MLKATYTSLALTDIRAVSVYLAEESPDSARRFQLALRDTIGWLKQFPEMGSKYPHPESENLRVKLVTGFSNYVVFYKASGEELTVIRVLHGSRDMPEVKFE